MPPSRRRLLLLGLVLVVIAAAAITYFAWPEPDQPLRVALTGKYPPFNFYDGQGNLVGFDVDVAREVADHLGRDIEFVTTQWDGILMGLLGGQYDLIIGSMADNEARRKKVNFSQPYYYSGAQLFVRRADADRFQSIEDMAGRKVAVGVGETFGDFLREKHPQVEVVSYSEGMPMIFQDLEGGRVEGFVSDLLVGLIQIEKNNAAFVPVGDLLYRERMAIPVKKGNDELLEQVNDAIDELKASGRLEQIAVKWLGEQGVKAVQEPEEDGVATYEGGQTSMSSAAWRLLRGFGYTLLVGVSSLVFGFILAIPSGAILNLQKGIACRVLRGVVDFLRGTPVLLQLFFVYFGLQQWGVSLTPLTAAILTLTVNSAAYMAEVVRSGLMSVDHGQKLAGRALGLSRLQVFRHIVWPQAFRIAIPPLMNSVVALIKDTALVGVIAVPEVLQVARNLVSNTFNPIYYVIVAIMFFAVTFPLMKLAGRLERKIREKGFAHD